MDAIGSIRPAAFVAALDACIVRLSMTPCILGYYVSGRLRYAKDVSTCFPNNEITAQGLRPTSKASEG